MKMEYKINPHKVGGEICKITGVDIFKNTRKREYVELRALVCYTLREDLNFGFQKIADYFKSRGKKMDHSSVIHMIKMYPIYKMHNKYLEKLEGSFNFDKSIQKNKKFTIKQQYQNLEYRYEKLKKELDSPMIKTMHNIPEDKWSEVLERIDMLKKSWAWKSKDKVQIIESSTGLSNFAY